MDVMDALYTKADYNALPEGFPAQLIEGCLVKEPSPTYEHNSIATCLFLQLGGIVAPELLPMPPSDVGLGKHDVYQPDIVVLRSVPAPNARDVGIPLLAIEILSPSTERRDRYVKRTKLIEAGTAEVWLIDPKERHIEVWSKAGMRLASDDIPATSDFIEGFRVIPTELFAPST